MKQNPPRIHIRPERIAAYITLISAVLGFVEQLRRTRDQVKVAVDTHRKQKSGFGFGRSS